MKNQISVRNINFKYDCSASCTDCDNDCRLCDKPRKTVILAYTSDEKLIHQIKDSCIEHSENQVNETIRVRFNGYDPYLEGDTTDNIAEFGDCVTDGETNNNWILNRNTILLTSKKTYSFKLRSSDSEN